MARFILAALLVAAFSASATVTPLPGSTPQRALAGDFFPAPIAVRVTDAAGMPVAGVDVRWSIFISLVMDVDPISIGCSIDLGYNCKRLTGPDGIAHLPRFLAPVAGSFKLHIFGGSGTQSLGSATIELTADPRVTPASLTAASGSGQMAVINTSYPMLFTARLVSSAGFPIAGARVVFRVTTPLYGVRGKFANRRIELGQDPYSFVATTDAEGYASSGVFIAGRGLGSGTVTAEYFDPDAKSFVHAPFEFTNVNADGSTFTSFQGMWWGGPAENGWGVAIVQHANMLFNVIFAYDGAGNPTWYVQPGGVWEEGLGSTFGTVILSPRSAPYFAYDPARFRLWELSDNFTGSARLSFNGPDAGVMRTCIRWVCADKRIERLAFPPDTDTPHLLDLGDMWWGGEEQNGWGIAISERKGVIFPVWFTYDEAGMPIWFPLEDGQWVDSHTYRGAIYRTSSSPWPANYDPSRLRMQHVGTFTFRFADRNYATFEYSLEGRSGIHPIVRLGF